MRRIRQGPTKGDTYLLRDDVAPPGADVIRLRDSNKDLRLGDFVSRVKLAWNREHASNRKTAIDGRFRMRPAFDPFVFFSLSIACAWTR